MPFIQLKGRKSRISRVNRYQVTLNKFLIQFSVPEIGKTYFDIGLFK